MKNKKIIIIFSLIVFTLMMTQAAPKLAYAAREDAHGEHEEHGSKKEKSSHQGHNEKEDGHDEEGINLDDDARKMINLKTAVVQRRKLGGRLKIYGKISKDTENYSYVTFNGEGKVDRIKVDLGRMVQKGDVLLTILRRDNTLEKIYSPMHGVVLSILVKPTERVDSLTSLISIMDVDTLRATIDIYEKDLRFIKEGQKVILKTVAFPEKDFYGKVVYISPQVSEQTQSIKVRVDVNNQEHLLRLGMFVSGELIYASGQGVLTVPDSAIQTLNGENIVFVSEEGDSLQLREVTLGQSIDHYTEIKSGLSVGERVVAQGSFYLKSEKAKSSFGGGHSH